MALLCNECGAKAPAPVAGASLEGAVARVGRTVLPPSLVADIEAATGASADEAIRDLVGDALAAEGAHERGIDRDPGVSWERVAALARRVPEHLADEARGQGPPSDDELASVLVVQVVVLRAPTLREEDALFLANAIRQAVLGARNVDEFIARAQSIAHPHARVIAQPVGPFVADGGDPQGGKLDSEFVAAAFALRTPRETSPIVATPFGWHVIQLVERKLPESPEEAATRAQTLGVAVQNLRGRMRLDALLRARKSSARANVAVAAEGLMARVAVDP